MAFDRLGLKIDAAWTFDLQGECLQDAGNHEQAVAAYHEAVRRFAEIQHDEGLGLNAVKLGHALYELGRYQQALPHFQTALLAYERLEQPINAAWKFAWKGASHREAGDDRQAVAAYQEAVQRFAELNFDHGLAENSHHLGDILYRLERFDEAASYFERAAAAYDRLDQPVDAAWMFSWKGTCYRDAGDDGQALAAYDEAVGRFSELNDQEGVNWNAFERDAALDRLERTQTYENKNINL